MSDRETQLARALAQLTHTCRGSVDVCIDCGQHVDAPVHHTPQRITGEWGPGVGEYSAQTPIHQAATLLATAVCTHNGGTEVSTRDLGSVRHAGRWARRG